MIKSHQALQYLEDRDYALEGVEDDTLLEAIVDVMQAMVEVADCANSLKNSGNAGM